MGKSTPRAPDPYKVSDAEAKASKETAAYNQSMNMVNQSSPFGSVSYASNGVDPVTGAPKYSQTTSLSPELQSLLNNQIGAQSGISSAISGQIGNLPTENFNPNIDVGDIRQRSYDSQLAMLEPQFERGRTQLMGTLNDRGLPLGSELSTQMMGDYDRARDTSLLGASRQAEQDANSEYQRQFSNEQSKYQMPFQNLSSLMGASSPVQSPSFGSYPTAQAQAPNTGQNVWNAYNAQAQQANQQNGQFASGLLGLGQLGLAAFSDIRLKRDIKRIGALPSGLPVYSYKYIWSDAPEVGVMAQEAMGMFPSAVSMHHSGYLQVRYDLLA